MQISLKTVRRCYPKAAVLGIYEAFLDGTGWVQVEEEKQRMEPEQLIQALVTYQQTGFTKVCFMIQQNPTGPVYGTDFSLRELSTPAEPSDENE